MIDKPCSCCARPRDRVNQRYCRACFAAWMRENRPKYSELTIHQRFKDKCRSYANSYKSRGKLGPEPCSNCGADHCEMHHEDYSKPLDVIWLCRPCHLAHHVKEKAHEKAH